MDCLFCRFPGPKPVVPSLAQEAIAFHCHRVPDSFQLPHCDGFVEVRDPLDLVRAPLVFLCSISGVFSSGRREVLGDFPGLCKILHETTLLGCPSCIPVFFFPTFVGSGLSWLYCMWRMEAIGRRWYCDSFNVGRPGRQFPPRFRPWVTVTGKEPDCCQDLWSQPSSSEMDDLHSLSSAACFLAWSSRTSWSAWASWSAWMSGLDFPVRGISL